MERRSLKIDRRGRKPSFHESESDAAKTWRVEGGALHEDDREAELAPPWGLRLRNRMGLAASNVLTVLDGAFRPTPWLSSIARAHVRSHLKNNRTSRLLRYGPLRQTLATISRHPLKGLTLAGLVYTAALAVTWSIPFIPWGPTTPASAEDYFRDFQTINLALMGAQATLLGLVYPLVIALVSLLFQETAARGARLNVYFKETEATAVGSMALVFVAVVSLQSLVYGQLPVRVVAAATVVNILWFTLNLVGLAFFVRSSLDFIRPTGRHRMLESYVANTAWPAQFLAVVRTNRLLGAQTYGYVEAPAEAGAVGLINPYEFDGVIASRTLSRPRTLVDVAFGRLNAVLRSQKRNAIFGRSPASITFAPSIDREYDEGRIDLVRGTGALSKAERLVLNRAYRFARPDRRDPSSLTQDLLTELVASAQLQFEAGNYDQFDARIDEATRLHIRLYELGANPRPPDSDPFNYAAIEEGWDTLGASWAATYRDLLNRAGDRIDREPRFFERLIYIPSRIHRRIRSVAPTDARKALFHLAALPGLALLDRAGQEKADTATAGTPAAIFSFPGAAGEKYKRFWINYVGGWESFGEELAALKRRGDQRPGWDELCALSDELFRHLIDTAMLTIRAAQIGETQAIGWTGDMLLNWRNRTTRRLNQDRGGWALHRPLLTLRHARFSWAEIEAAPLTMDNQPKDPAGVFGGLMENAWFDTVVITLSNLLARCPDPVDGVIPDSGAGRASLALYHNRTFDHGASRTSEARQMDLGTLLRSLLRRADRASGYGADLDGITERIDRLDGPNYVSGRVYSWSGSGDDSAVADPQIVLLASTTAVAAGRRRDAFEIGDDTRRLLLPPTDEGRRRLLDHLTDFLRRADEADQSRASALLSLLLERPVDATETEARLEAVKALLTACRAVIEAERLVALQTAEFDPERVTALEAKIAETAFTPTGFPLALFTTVVRVEQPLPRITFRLGGLRRGAYTTPQLEEPWSEGDDYLRDHYTPLVASRVLLDALQARRPTRRSPRTADGWWRLVKQGIAAVRAAGLTPLIIRGARDEPRWLRDWYYDLTGETRPVDMQLEFRNGQGEGYDFHLNEVPVYSDLGGQDATWIVAREMFTHVAFEDFGAGRMVRAHLTVNAQDPWKASLAMEWGRQVTVAETPFWRIAHPAA